MSTADLRPLGFGEILDGAFTLYRNNFATLFATALIPNLPIAAFWLLVPSASTGADPMQAGAAGGAAAVALYPYAILVAILIWAALTHQISEAYTGGEAEVGAGYRRALGRLFPLIVSGIAASIAIFFGMLLFVIPGLLLAIMFFAAVPAIVVEGKGPFSALGRSRSLAKKSWGRIFGVCFVGFTIVALPAMAIGFASGIGAAMVGPDALAAIDTGRAASAAQAANTIVSALTTPFLVGCIVLLYYDRRVRTEALDLEMATDAVATQGAAAE